VLEEIGTRFGKEVIAADGSLDRAALRTRVLSDPGALIDLNRIVHPEVHRRRKRLVEEARRRGDRIVVSDIPLLFEAANPAEFDAIVLVDAPEAVRRSRLVASRSLPANDVDRLIAAQLPSSLKRTRSDYVIENAGNLAALERAASAVWKALLARA
jgi:dephospho-CoA kinase